MAPGPTKLPLLQCQSPGSPTQVGSVWREEGTCTSLISSRWTLSSSHLPSTGLNWLLGNLRWLFFPKVSHGKCLEVFSPKAAAKRYYRGAGGFPSSPPIRSVSPRGNGEASKPLHSPYIAPVRQTAPQVWEQLHRWPRKGNHAWPRPSSTTAQGQGEWLQHVPM